MADPRDPEFIWNMVQECGEQERHFNTIQGAYRGLASTWLLAMFAGIGYILDNKINPTHLLIALTGASIAFGIALLWMLDVLVYHRLLLAAFEEGRNLEDSYAWLPQIRNRMRAQGRYEEAGRCATWFYVGLALAGALVCAVELAQILVATNWAAAVIAFAATMSVFTLLARLALHKADTLTRQRAATTKTNAASSGGTAQAD
jgi:hypothetical protein